MKALAAKANENMTRQYCRAQTKAFLLRRRARAVLADNSGSFLSDHALAIVITVVVAGILLVLVLNLYKDKIMPNTETKVDEFFAMTA